MASAHLAVLGDPIDHSKSPDIHAAAYEYLELNWDYGRYQITQEGLASFLQRRDDSWRGLSLTMPLKQAAFELATAVDEYAAKTHIANTLVKTGANWIGYNTDVFGLKQAIGLALSESPERVVVVGSGATATSAAMAMSELFPNAELAISARNKQAVDQIVQRLDFPITYASLDDVPNSDLLVSTLPSGLLSTVEYKTAALFDVSYSGNAAQNTIAPATDMLLWQAIAQIRIFVGGDSETALENESELLSVMRQAL